MALTIKVNINYNDGRPENYTAIRKGLIMVNGEVEVLFFDSWAWLIFVGIGLGLIVLELFVGVDTGLDLVFIGTTL